MFEQCHAKAHVAQHKQLNLRCLQIFLVKYVGYIYIYIYMCVCVCWVTRLVRHEHLGSTHSWVTSSKAVREIISVKFSHKNRQSQKTFWGNVVSSTFVTASTGSQSTASRYVFPSEGPPWVFPEVRTDRARRARGRRERQAKRDGGERERERERERPSKRANTERETGKEKHGKR